MPVAKRGWNRGELHWQVRVIPWESWESVPPATRWSMHPAVMLHQPKPAMRGSGRRLQWGVGIFKDRTVK